ncbi:hypothetical protein F4860DRAFT_324885 [Xylaria cubensis]|nr:hypothetical protein F4860DRAFT_324885 [Xylaria cubensis]
MVGSFPYLYFFCCIGYIRSVLATGYFSSTITPDFPSETLDLASTFNHPACIIPGAPGNISSLAVQRVLPHTLPKLVFLHFSRLY